MKQEFVTYEQAIALKELGFDDPCFGFYDESLYFPNNENQYGTFCKQPKDVPACSAPLKQQVFRWFREKHGLEVILRPDSLNDPSKNLREYVIVSYDKKWELEKYVEPNHFLRKGLFKTFEEAESACIDKLIEIVKGGKQ